MKKIIALIMACTLIFTSCSPQSIENKTDVEIKDTNVIEDEKAEQYSNTACYVENTSDFEMQESSFMDMERRYFDSIEDTDFTYYIEDIIYADIINQLNSDEYFVENVEVTYISKEYLEELDLTVSNEEWFNNIKSFAEKHGYAASPKEYKRNPDSYKGHVGDLCEAIRVMVTGRTKSPDLYSILKILGKESIRERISFYQEVVL